MAYSSGIIGFSLLFAEASEVLFISVRDDEAFFTFEALSWVFFLWLFVNEVTDEAGEEGELDRGEWIEKDDDDDSEDEDEDEDDDEDRDVRKSSSSLLFCSVFCKRFWLIRLFSIE